MPRPPREVIECRDYKLMPEFPVLLVPEEERVIADRREEYLHFHNHLELGYCVSGSGTIWFQDCERHYKAGDAAVIGAGTPHTTCSDPGCTSRWRRVMVDPVRLIDPITSAAELPLTDLYSDLLFNYHALLTPEVDIFDGLIVKEIASELAAQGTNYKRCVKTLLDTLMNRLDRAAPFYPSTREEKPFHISPALRYVAQHYMDDLRIDDLAEQCDMSISYFRRVFTETVGQSPLDYLNHTRINRACALLSTTDYPVAIISEATGFHSVSNFNRRFTAIVGKPPTSWRRSQLGLDAELDPDAELNAESTE